ncbi:flippase, partial [Archaeoglobales archaeon]
VGNEAVGFYSAAYRLIASLNIIPLAFIASIFPVTSQLYVSSNETLKFAFERSFKYMLILGIFTGVLITLLSERIIIFIYGKGYTPSITILQILIWAEAIFFINSTIRNLLESINKQVIITYLMVLGVTSNVVMNWLLIPMYSYIGASFATVATRLFVFLLHFAWVMKSGYRLSNETLMSAIKIIAFLLAIWVLFCLFNLNAYLFAAVFVGTFLSTLHILKIIDETDKKLIKNAISFFRMAKGD